MSAADFTIAEFLAWVRTKPAGERYDFTRSKSCAVAQFGRATRRRNLVGLKSDELRQLGLLEVVNPLGGDCRFGSLVRRLEALLPAEPLSDTWTHADAYLTDIEDVARERVSA